MRLRSFVSPFLVVFNESSTSTTFFSTLFTFGPALPTSDILRLSNCPSSPWRWNAFAEPAEPLHLPFAESEAAAPNGRSSTRQGARGTTEPV